MFYKEIVQRALHRTWLMDNKARYPVDKTSDGQSSITSRLIYDIFGGEILKTQFKNGWHFYNRVDGERIDFSISDPDKTSADIPLEDMLSTPDETLNYFQEEDYSNLFIKFTMVFEEVVGLKRSRFKIAS